MNFFLPETCRHVCFFFKILIYKIATKKESSAPNMQNLTLGSCSRRRKRGTSAARTRQRSTSHLSRHFSAIFALHVVDAVDDWQDLLRQSHDRDFLGAFDVDAREAQEIEIIAATEQTISPILALLSMIEIVHSSST